MAAVTDPSQLQYRGPGQSELAAPPDEPFLSFFWCAAQLSYARQPCAFCAAEDGIFQLS